jgi:uridine kinase
VIISYSHLEAMSSKVASFIFEYLMNRSELFTHIAQSLSLISKPHPIRVAVDGVDAAGKTIFADELAGYLKNLNRDVIQASIDGFHRPRKERYEQGADSPEGYYYDSFDYDAIQKSLLIPLGPDGDLEFIKAVFNYRTDTPVQESRQTAHRDSILLFDGVFLLRPELIQYWDYTIFIRVDFEIVLKRVLIRDQNLFGTTEVTKERYLKRYIPGQKMYLQGVNPESRADIVIINDDPVNPVLKMS